MFSDSPLSSEPADRMLFPQTVIETKDQIVNLEVIDSVQNVKLRQYYSRSRHTGSTVESDHNIIYILICSYNDVTGIATA